MATIAGGTEQIRAMSRAELAGRYRVTPRTLTTWIKRFSALGDLHGRRLLAPCEVRMIFETIGEPPEQAVNKHN